MPEKNKFIVSEAARDDISEAYDWYEEQSEGTGDRFFAKVNSCLSGIEQNPEMYAARGDGQRAAPLKRFPYLIFYTFVKPVIRVLRVFHTSQDPGKLK